MKLRTYFEDFGVTRKDFELIGKLDGLDDASFLRKLSALCDRLIARTDSRVNHVVLLFDEFDKLLEIYRGEHRAEVEELINQLRRAATEEDRIGLALAGSDLMKEVFDWSAPRELESYFPRISTGRSAGFMFTRASSNSFGGT